MKIFNIGKANAEIERLQKENAEAKEAIAALEENAKTLEASAEESAKELARVNSALEAKETRIKQLEAALLKQEEASNTIKVDFEAKAKELTEREAKLNEEVEKKASAKALEIAASQGAQPPPKEQEPGEAGKPKASELTGIERAKAAFSAQIAAMK